MIDKYISVIRSVRLASIGIVVVRIWKVMQLDWFVVLILLFVDFYWYYLLLVLKVKVDCWLLMM